VCVCVHVCVCVCEREREHPPACRVALLSLSMRMAPCPGLLSNKKQSGEGLRDEGSEQECGRDAGEQFEVSLLGFFASSSSPLQPCSHSPKPQHS